MGRLVFKRSRPSFTNQPAHSVLSGVAGETKSETHTNFISHTHVLKLLMNVL